MLIANYDALRSRKPRPDLEDEYMTEISADAELIAACNAFWAHEAKLTPVNHELEKAEEAFFAARRSEEAGGDPIPAAFLKRVKAAETAQDRALGAWIEILDEIVDTPAQTLEGLKAKARVARRWSEIDDRLTAIFESIVDDLIGEETADAASRCPLPCTLIRAEMVGEMAGDEK